jgi:hypothetical protein
MKNILLILITVIQSTAFAQSNNVTFKVDMNGISDTHQVYLKGNISPIADKGGIAMTDLNQDGIYEVKVAFKSNARYVKYRFTNKTLIELDGSDDRILWFKNEDQTISNIFNEYEYYGPEEIDKLTFTREQLEEDIAILKRVIQYIHPNIYKYRDSLGLQQDFELLQKEMLANPVVTNIYKAVSKFAANIKCSHTFTNPWNQGWNMKKAVFHQPDKIPFTFDRIEKRLFIDKNASNNEKIEKGLEILSINDIPTDEIMTKLAQYTTSDGNNYEKKLERLIVDGTEKFALFDIFYSLEFGSNPVLGLELKDHKNGHVFKTSVNTISKTKRTYILTKRYGPLDNSLKNGWKFEIKNEHTAYLKMNSFAVQRGEFDWQEFLKRSFKELNQKNIKNLTIDIRGNEGGQGEVGEYILEHLVQSPLDVPAMSETTRYQSIPDDIRKYISTWSKFPYDFGNKISVIGESRYKLKGKYSPGGKTYKPLKDGFRGKTYLMTNASNSSATHLMATYAKQIDGVTIVGQETGGNQKGINGNFIFFFKLPNSKVEIDIPAIGMNAITDSEKVYDGGVIPNVIIKKNAADFVSGRDTELNQVLELIKNN